MGDFRNFLLKPLIRIDSHLVEVALCGKLKKNRQDTSKDWDFIPEMHFKIKTMKLMARM